MMNILKENVFLFIPVLILLISACLATAGKNPELKKSSSGINVIAFGSCSHQDKPQPILELAAAQNPDLFIYLGDNIYNDSYSIKKLRDHYMKLGAKPEFKKLKASTDILATWDDHDYGWNDSGNDYPYSSESKRIFLDFFKLPDKSLYKHRGIYYSRLYREGPLTVQIILLDVRTFRDRLLKYRKSRDGESELGYIPKYSPHTSPGRTMLGKEQWRWLEKQLRQNADLRIIGTGTQFSATYNGFETWANFPHEQKRMVDLIKRTGAEGVLFISGDIHYAEISALRKEGVYPLYDITSSGITQSWDFTAPNGNRIEGPVKENNFGLITIDKERSDPEVKVQIYDVNGNIRINRKIKLGTLKF